MGDMQRCTLTDAELEAQGVEIPESETDASFFEWLDNMIKEVCGEESPKEPPKKPNANKK